MFLDRYDAGQRLAVKLKEYKNSATVVLALPRGGVLVGHEIATELNLPLDVVITRKIGHPLNKEIAICAVTEDGRRVCDDYSPYAVDKNWIDRESQLAVKEATRRRLVYGVLTPQSLRDKTVIVTDDGIATGLTMKAALMSIPSQKPRKIVLALPVCPPEVLRELKSQVDEVVVLDESKPYRGAVGAYYTHFPEVSDKQVVDCLKDVAQMLRLTNLKDKT